MDKNEEYEIQIKIFQRAVEGPSKWRAVNRGA